MKFYYYNVLLILVIVLISSCGRSSSTSFIENSTLTPVPTNTPAPAPTVLLTPADQDIVRDAKVQVLLDHMTQQGIDLKLLGESRVAFLHNSAPGVSYRVNNADQLYIHVFTNKESSSRLAKSIPNDADTGSTEWSAPPHFFLCDTLIVVYVGSDTTVMDPLVKMCGSQFAGNT